MAHCPSTPSETDEYEMLGTVPKFRLNFFGVIFLSTEGLREHKPLLFCYTLH